MQELYIIQSKIKAPKNQKNSFGNYNYRSCEDIIEALKPILKEVEATLTIDDDIINIIDRFYVKATASLFRKDGTLIAKTSAFAREELTKKGSDAAQLTGATSSYARKYALNGLLLIDDTKDADATNTHGKETMGMTHQEIAADWPIEQRQAALDKALTELAGIGDVETFKAKKASFTKLYRDYVRYNQQDMATELTEAINTTKTDLGIE